MGRSGRRSGGLCVLFGGLSSIDSRHVLSIFSCQLPANLGTWLGSNYPPTVTEHGLCVKENRQFSTSMLVSQSVPSSFLAFTVTGNSSFGSPRDRQPASSQRSLMPCRVTSLCCGTRATPVARSGLEGEECVSSD